MAADPRRTLAWRLANSWWLLLIGLDAVLDFATVLDLPPDLMPAVHERAVCLPRQARILTTVPSGTVFSR